MVAACDVGRGGAQDVDQERARLQVHHHDGREAGTMIAARRCGAA